MGLRSTLVVLVFSATITMQVQIGAAHNPKFRLHYTEAGSSGKGANYPKSWPAPCFCDKHLMASLNSMRQISTEHCASTLE